MSVSQKVQVRILLDLATWWLAWLRRATHWGEMAMIPTFWTLGWESFIGMLLCLSTLCNYDRVWIIYKEHGFISQSSETRKAKAKPVLCTGHLLAPCCVLKCRSGPIPAIHFHGHPHNRIIPIKYSAPYTIAIEIYLHESSMAAGMLSFPVSLRLML